MNIPSIENFCSGFIIIGGVYLIFCVIRLMLIPAFKRLFNIGVDRHER
jgi:hypothetical protein